MKKGDIVEIKNITLSGKTIVEGKAELLEPMTPSGMSNGQLWKVRFEGETETFMRWVKA
jgi:hypothetical protein